MARYKVVITDFTDPQFDIEKGELHSSGLDIDLVCLNTRSADEIIQHATDADAVIVQFAQITRDVIQHLKRCRVISRYGIGVDMIDIPAATERGIWVCNVPDFCIDEVSSHTLAFLLCLNRRIHLQDRMVHAGKWVFTAWGPPERLAGQLLGLVGLGKIGRAVAHKAKAFGLSVVAYDPYIDPQQAEQLGVQLAGLEDLLRRSDYVSVHCPLTAETRHLIGETQLRLMKPSAYLINMARGPIVDQRALHQALVQHVIAGAALDVLEQEPPPTDEPLLQLDNVILTPHSSSASVEAVTQLRRDTARNVVIVLQGGYPPSILNRKELNLPDAQH